MNLSHDQTVGLIICLVGLLGAAILIFGKANDSIWSYIFPILVIAGLVVVIVAK